MDALSILDRAQSAGLMVMVGDDDRLMVEGEPTPEVEALVQELRLHKYDVLALLTGRTVDEAESLRKLMSAEAAPTVPLIRFTMRETEDVLADTRWLCLIHRLIEEHQPGEGRVIMAIRRLDGRRVRVEWRARCGRALGLAIGNLLARRSKEERKYPVAEAQL